MQTVNVRTILTIIGITMWLAVQNSISDYDYTVNAQSLSGKSDGFTKNMKPYTNDKYKFTISYPTSWDKIW